METTQKENEPIYVDSWFSYRSEHPNFTGCMIDKDNDKLWVKNGKDHREDGPACVFHTSTKMWLIEGLKHREDGPAIVWFDGEKEWWLNGEQYTEEEYKLAVRKHRIDKVMSKITNSTNN